jgi:Tfp pilus assembly protein PilE
MIVSIVIVATCSSINNPSFEALLLLPHRRTARTLMFFTQLVSI